MPYTVNIHERGAEFHRFDVGWTPTVLIMDANGVERDRIEGYLPRDDFHARLQLALGRVAFKGKKWQDAERWYGQVAEKCADASCAAEALYWRSVSRYQATHDPTPLVEVARELQVRYPDSEWATKATPWLPEEHAAKAA